MNTRKEKALALGVKFDELMTALEYDGDAVITPVAGEEAFLVAQEFAAFVNSDREVNAIWFAAAARESSEPHWWMRYTSGAPGWIAPPRPTMMVHA